MPYINLRVAGKLSREQRSAIAKEFSETLERIAKKPKNTTYLVIDEVERDHWAVGDQLLE